MSTAINLLDRNSESRKVLWAILAAFFIHLLVAFSLATFSGRLAPLPEVEDKPAELTIVNVMPDAGAGPEECAIHGDPGVEKISRSSEGKNI